jgi:WD40 repeat protein
MKRLFISLFVLVVLAVSVQATFAQDDGALYGCHEIEKEHPYSEYWWNNYFYSRYEPTTVRPVYEYRNRHFVLRDVYTQAIVKTLDTSLETPDFIVKGWTSDCRYVVGGYLVGNDYKVFAWDTITGQRVSELEKSFRIGNRTTHWSPSGGYVLYGGSLWHIPSNTKFPLSNTIGLYGETFHHVAWDMTRGQVLVVHVDSGYAVTAYDLVTGQQVGFFSVDPQSAAPTNFALSPDGTKVAVFTSEKERIYDNRPTGLAVWDRDTLTGIQLDAEGFAAGEPSQVAFSPDNRYMVIGRDEIRVWDFQNLRADGKPNFMYTVPISRIGMIRFVDNTTLETDLIRISRYLYRWDLMSGEFVNAYDRRDGQFVDSLYFLTD